MPDDDATWVVFFTLAMALLVVGVLPLENAAWYVQYPVLAAALVLSVVAALRAMAESGSES